MFSKSQRNSPTASIKISATLEHKQLYEKHIDRIFKIINKSGIQLLVLLKRWQRQEQIKGTCKESMRAKKRQFEDIRLNQDRKMIREIIRIKSQSRSKTENALGIMSRNQYKLQSTKRQILHPNQNLNESLHTKRFNENGSRLKLKKEISAYLKHRNNLLRWMQRGDKSLEMSSKASLRESGTQNWMCTSVEMESKWALIDKFMRGDYTNIQLQAP